jgi:hypothetical protein
MRFKTVFRHVRECSVGLTNGARLAEKVWAEFIARLWQAENIWAWIKTWSWRVQKVWTWFQNWGLTFLENLDFASELDFGRLKKGFLTC